MDEQKEQSRIGTGRVSRFLFKLWGRRKLIIGKMVVPLGWYPSCLTPTSQKGIHPIPIIPRVAPLSLRVKTPCPGVFPLWVLGSLDFFCFCVGWAALALVDKKLTQQTCGWTHNFVPPRKLIWNPWKSRNIYKPPIFLAFMLVFCGVRHVNGSIENQRNHFQSVLWLGSRQIPV